MRHIFTAVLGCLLLVPVVSWGDIPRLPSGELRFPDGVPASQMGGLIIVRQGNVTTWTLGGGLFPRAVKVVAHTPQGVVVTRFTLPGNAQQSLSIAPLFNQQSCPAGIWIEVPRENSILYVGDELVHGFGKKRALESPPLQMGVPCALQLRVASVMGENFVIEDRQIQIRAGEVTSVTFDGSSALVVPLSQLEPAAPEKK
jgi:hypothetical protein